VLLGREPGPSVWLAGTGVALGSALLGTFVFSRLRETLAEAA